MKVEDKSKEVVYWIYGYYHGVDKVEEDESAVEDGLQEAVKLIKK